MVLVIDSLSTIHNLLVFLKSAYWLSNISSFAMADLTTEGHMLVASDSTNQRKLSKKYKVNQRTSVIVVFVNYISNKNLPIFYIFCFCVFYEYKNVLQCILFYRKIN
jgi:hypothetical protein